MNKKNTILLILLLLIPFTSSGQLVNLKNGVEVTLTNSTLFHINGSIKIDAGAILNAGLNASDSTNIYLTGDYEQDGLFNQRSSGLWFVGGENQNLFGTSNLIFKYLFVTKSNDYRVIMGDNVFVSSLIRLMGGRLDIDVYDLTMDAGALFSHNYLTASGENDFTDTNSVYMSKGTNTGFLKQKISSSADILKIVFPISTPKQDYDTDSSVYSYALVDFWSATSATFGADAYITIKTIPEEHPAVEINDRSLMKYWIAESNDVTILDPDGINWFSKYGQTDVPLIAYEGNFQVLFYSPADYKSDPLSYWRINPGIQSDVVNFNQNIFYSNSILELDGDWTVGDKSVASLEFYSIVDGDYNTVGTWSNESFGGAPSTKTPNKQTDMVYIGDDKVITLASQPAISGLVEIQTDATLIVDGDYYFSGDTLRIEDEAIIKIAHSEGFTSATSTISHQGCFQTDIRDYSSNVCYQFIGNVDQHTGDGLPNIVASVRIDKPAANTLLLDKTVSIQDSLVLVDGIFNLNSNTIHGLTVGRLLKMTDGELIVYNSFPENYISPTFTAGKITFTGTGNVVVSSSGSIPAVQQYYNLNITGTHDGTITFNSAGNINISNEFDISTLIFAPELPERFITDGSTVVFNMDNVAGSQAIPNTPGNIPVNDIVNLTYYNIIFDGAGEKIINSQAGMTFKIYNDLEITNNAEFNANSYDIFIQNDWLNTGGTYIPTNRTVIFSSETQTYTNYIQLNSNINPFNNIAIQGLGIVETSDDLDINGDLIIDGGIFKGADKTIKLAGSWYNNNGSFVYDSSTIEFDGIITQILTKDNGSENFWNLTVNCDSIYAGNISGDADPGLFVLNDLSLQKGILHIRDKYIQIDSTVIRPGTNVSHVDGSMRKFADTNSVTLNFEIGYGRQYTPIEIEFDGIKGRQGYIDLNSDTVLVATSPVSFSGGILPANSELNDIAYINRQWTFSIPSSSNFEIGLFREYDATVTFINPEDLKTGATPIAFEPRILTDTGWVLPYRFGNPSIGTRTATTTQYFDLSEIGTIVVGMPDPPNFYSINSGNAALLSNWSTEGYGGVPTTTAISANSKIYIGDGKRMVIDFPVALDGLVNIDSSGTLVMIDDNIMSGTGEFRMLAHSTLEIGSMTGISSSGPTGNIQMTTRNYNYNYHSQGNFVYISSANSQVTGAGLPDTVKTLSLNTGLPNIIVDLQNDIYVKDSLYVQSGELECNKNIILLGANMNFAATGSMDPKSSTVIFAGIGTDTIRYSHSGDSLTFYNLSISKTDSAGNIVLWKKSPIAVEHELTFDTGNKANIEARLDSNYVQINNGATVSGFGPGNGYAGRGWVDGEIRKWIPAGSSSSYTFFEVGDNEFWTPYNIRFTENGGTAGYIGMEIISDGHPYMDAAYKIISPDRMALRYWRLTKPWTSTFEQDGRKIRVRVDMAYTEDVANVDHYACMDMAMFQGTPNEITKWIHFIPYDDGSNYNLSGGMCSDTREIPDPNLSYQYNASDYDNTFDNYSSNNAFVEAWPNSNNEQPFGTSLASPQVFSTGDILLGDFILGNSASRVYRTFYSIKSGNWNDPTVWSTVSHNSTVNAGSTINVDFESTPRPSVNYPITQYEHAYIGNGDTIYIEGGIGHETFTGNPVQSSYPHYLGKVGANVTVEEEGTLDLSVGILNGHSFEINKWGTLIVGSSDGIRKGTVGWGNIYCSSRTFADSINVIYKPTGSTPRGSILNSKNMIYTFDRAYGSNYIKRVTVLDGATILMENITNNTMTDEFAFQEYAPRVTAGNTYTIQVESDISNSSNCELRIDLNRNGSFDTGEQIFNTSFGGNSILSQNFTVPASLLPGVTFMRVFYSGNEYEMYGLIVENNTVDITQNTGDGLPDNLQSMTIHKIRDRDDKVVLGNNNLTVRDSLYIKGGKFDLSGNNVKISGDMICDTTDGLLANSGSVLFYGFEKSYIKGSGNLDFYDMTIYKGDGLYGLDTAIVNIDIEVNIIHDIEIESETIVELEDNNIFTIEENANLTATTISNKRMFKVSGTKNSGTLKKQFTMSTNQKQFVYPVGIDTVYYPADLQYLQTSVYSGIPSLSVQLIDSLHEKSLNPSLLKKFWKVQSENIDNVDSKIFEFKYTINDTVGDGREYIPGAYDFNANKWEVNLGDIVSAIDGVIYCEDNSGNFDLIDADWTAGEPLTFFDGRTYYSRDAGGLWSENDSWSNYPISGYQPPTSYFPGEHYSADTVIIECNTILYDIDDRIINVDSLQVGDCDNSCQSFLTFDDNLGIYPMVHKSLIIDRSLGICTGGTINRIDEITNDNRDTLTVNVLFSNTSATTEGFRAEHNSTDFTILRFAGDTNTVVTGEGVWDTYSEIILDKTDKLADTLIVKSTTFTTRTSTSPDLLFVPTGGVIRQAAAATFYLSGGANDIIMGVGSGFHVTNGVLASKSSIQMNSNTVIEVDGGDLHVGEVADDNLIYTNGSKIDLQDGEIIVAGALSRLNPISEIELNITNNSTILVNNIGATDVNNIAFDVSSAASSFSMTGGRIVIAKPISGSQADFRVNATAGIGMTGGTIQFGDSTQTYTNEVFQAAGTLPLYNVHSVGANASTQIIQSNYTITNDLEIDNNNKFSLNGNILNISGNISNFGDFEATPGIATTDNWKLILTGTNTQYIYSADAGGNLYNNGIILYNLVIDKTGGKVILGSSSGAGNSNIIINNNLEFSENNITVINSRDNNLYVLLAEDGFGSTNNILRNGKGHIDGYMYRDITAENVDYKFYVGDDDNIDNFYPLTFNAKGTLGNYGILSSLFNKIDHPDIDVLVVDDEKNLQLYWNFDIPTGSNFVLDSPNGEFDLKTQFINPADLRAETSIPATQHFIYTPGCPDPTNCHNTGSWTDSESKSYTDSTITTTENDLFGDFVVGEPASMHFYSKTSGDWADMNNWVIDSYTSGVAALRQPNIKTDFVHIGNGCVIFVENFKHIHSLLLEDTDALEPGILEIRGIITDIKGQLFSIDDSCTIAVQHVNGLDGAINTVSRIMGVANYKYNLNTGSQNSGFSLPDIVASIIVDNQNLNQSNNSLMISEDMARPSIIIRDSLSIINGDFEPYRRDLEFYGKTSLYNQSKFGFTYNKTQFKNPVDNRIEIYNYEGIELNEVEIIGGDINFTKGVNAPDDIFVIKDLLTFTSSAKINVRNVNSYVRYKSKQDIVRSDLLTSGWVNGELSRYINQNNASVVYEIGDATKYLPTTFQYDNGIGGDSGYVKINTNTPVPDEPYYGNRLDIAHKVPEFWTVLIDSLASDTLVPGTRLFDLEFDMPIADIATVSDLKAVIRFKSVDDIWNERKSNQLEWNNTATRAILNILNPEPIWSEFGEFYIGEKAERTFYSCSNGDWDDNSIWSFNAACTDMAPVGIYPNSDWNSPIEVELEDRVVIQTGNNVALNTLPELYRIDVESGGTFTINDATYVSESSTGTDGIHLEANSNLVIKSAEGIESGIGSGVIHFQDANIDISTTTNFEFSGSVLQTLGAGFPAEIGNLTIANTAIGANSIVELPDYALTMNGNLTVTDGELRTVSNNSDISIAGDILVATDAIIDLTQNAAGNPTETTLTIDGSGNTNQNLTGDGQITVYDMIMDRGAGSGQFDIQRDLDIDNSFDFVNAGNTEEQIVVLTGNAIVKINNCNEDAVIDYDATHYFDIVGATAELSRLICPNNDYVFPIGSDNTYTPADFEAGASGTSGYLAIRTQQGSSPTFADGHKHLAVSATQYLGRLWTVTDNSTVQINGLIRFNYDQTDFHGSDENLLTTAGRWRPQLEADGGPWNIFKTPDIDIDVINNNFETTSNFNYTDLLGDWTLGDDAAFKRIFYSLITGDWNNGNSWTPNSSHTGTPFGVFPNLALDSVIIGANHTISMQNDVSISGVNVGTDNTNIGILNTAGYAVLGNTFHLNDNSTLIVTSINGISQIGQPDAAFGNILTNNIRDYGGALETANFVYAASATQIAGSGLPADINGLTIANTGAGGDMSVGTPGDNIVTLAQNTTLSGDLTILNGILDIEDYTVNRNAIGGTLTISDLASLRIGSINNLLTAVNNYATYNIEENSYIEFNGTDQFISHLPANLDVNVGFANVNLLNSSNKTVDAALIIRGNLYIGGAAILINNVGVNALSVRKNVTNCSTILNDGVLQIGQ